jgi:hypothetical protein
MAQQPPRIVQISPIAALAPPHDVTVFGLDDEGGLWKWDSGMAPAEWAQVCLPVKTRATQAHWVAKQT